MSRPKIYVNPNFQGTQVHVNPNFVPRTETVVHVNPLFLQASSVSVSSVESPESTCTVIPPKVTSQPLIRKTRHKLLRIKHTPSAVSPVEKKEVTRVPMIKLGRNKLIKANIFAGISRAVASKQKLSPGKYKVDNRQKRSQPKVVKVSRHKTLALKKINGTIYKTSKNRLERQSSNSTNLLPHVSKHSDRLISMNGSKFILKEGGKRLIPIKTPLNMPSSSKQTLEIAGIRFVQLTDGTFVRHHSHPSSIVRQHLTTSKHKSIKILTQKLRKCNIPCPVFRRLGKCLAHTRGRCPKTHERKFVDICPAALRKNGCTKVGCLLSHDLSLSKMPTCKYFLQGCCTNESCPFLHNKVNENAALCEEFQKGFCPDADRVSE